MAQAYWAYFRAQACLMASIAAIALIVLFKFMPTQRGKK